MTSGLFRNSRLAPGTDADLLLLRLKGAVAEDHCLYVAAEALRCPVLNVLRGSRLLETVSEVTFGPGEWVGLAEEPYAPL